MAVTTENIDELYLPDRDSIELAWQSTQITGGAPTLLPILDALMNVILVGDAKHMPQGASFYLSGELAAIMRTELIGSLGIVALYAANEKLTNAATDLLHTLQPKTAVQV